MKNKARDTIKKLKTMNKKIEDGVLNSYKAIEKGTVGAYKSIENAVVGTYKRIEDNFVDTFLREDGESVQEAKERINNQLNKK